MMTKRSLFLFGACALAVAALRRQAADVRAQATRETRRCERLLKGLDARCAAIR